MGRIARQLLAAYRLRFGPEIHPESLVSEIQNQKIVRQAPSIDTYQPEDFVLHDYAPHAHIKAPVAV